MPTVDGVSLAQPQGQWDTESEDEVEETPIKSVHEEVSIQAWCAWLVGISGVVLVAIGLMSPRDDSLWCLAIGLLLYGLMLLELCQGKACSFLSNVQSEEDFLDYVETLQQSEPVISFHVQNYHYETRTREVHKKDSRGHRRTTQETYQERVNTHSASQSYPIAGFTDETLSPLQTVAMFHLVHQTGSIEKDTLSHKTVSVQSTGERKLILLCSFPLEFHPRDLETQNNRYQFEQDFFRIHSTDMFQDKSVSHALNCPHAERAMVILSSDGRDVTSKPWWMSRAWLFLSTVFLVGVPFRAYVYRKAEKIVWAVTKHYSSCVPSSWAGEPIHSLKQSSDEALARVANLGPDLKIKRDEGGFLDVCATDVCPDVAADLVHAKSFAGIELDPPRYWRHQDLGADFDVMAPVNQKFLEKIQQLLDGTFIDKGTRDRQGAVPSRLIVETAHRVEDRELWQRYADKRNEIALRRICASQLSDMEGSGEIKTQRHLGEFNQRLAHGVNEFYLFHGSSPAGVLGIGQTGFLLKFVGTGAGSMFGPGSYFAEASSKGDEYASCEPSGLFRGKCAMLLCRVVCGELFRVTESDKPAIQEAMASGRYDSVVGDREASVGTYREFVVYDEAQIYPEYVIIYRRKYD